MVVRHLMAPLCRRAAALEAASLDAEEAEVEPEYEIDDAQLGAGGAQASEGA